MNNFTFTNIIDTDYYKNLASAIHKSKNHYIFWGIIFGLAYALIVSPILTFFAFHTYIITLSCIFLAHSIWYFFQESKYYKEMVKNSTELMGIKITQTFNDDSFSVECADFKSTYSYKMVKGVYETDTSFCIIINRYDGVVVSKRSITAQQLESFRAFITAKANFGTIKIKRNSRNFKTTLAWVLILSFIPVIYGTISLRLFPQTFENSDYTITLNRTFKENDSYYTSSYENTYVIMQSHSYNDISKNSQTGEYNYVTFLQEEYKDYYPSSELFNIESGKDGNNYYCSFETNYNKYCYLYCIPANTKVVVATFECNSKEYRYDMQYDFEKWAKSINVK